ncbi:hypothetical protein FKP32DRAFT_1587086, partial [Trametes sanguinea]
MNAADTDSELSQPTLYSNAQPGDPVSMGCAVYPTSGQPLPTVWPLRRTSNSDDPRCVQPSVRFVPPISLGISNI